LEELKIYLEDSREVTALRERIIELEGELVKAQDEARKLEFRYRCESVVNQELVDLCRQHGVKFRPALAARPWEDSPF